MIEINGNKYDVLEFGDIGSSWNKFEKDVMKYYKTTDDKKRKIYLVHDKRNHDSFNNEYPILANGPTDALKMYLKEKGEMYNKLIRHTKNDYFCGMNCLQDFTVRGPSGQNPFAGRYDFVIR